MDLTRSYEAVIPADVRARYDWAEVRNAAAVLSVTNPDAFAEIVEVLRDFRIQRADIVEPGGNRSLLAERVDGTFRGLGWREGQHDTRVASVLTLQPYRAAGERAPRLVESEVINVGYKVDNVKDRIALDVEWNAKDGNLDRDLANYRALYEFAIIDAAVLVTRRFDSIRDLATALGRDGAFNATTTTTIDKVLPRLTRGGGGGCPILVAAITSRCYTP